nr:helix-turn-helix domain-containing protein [Shimia biformata]
MDHRSPCPISSFLDLWGDKWSLIVIRDLMVGKTRYKDLADGPETVPDSILANRLKKLAEWGVVDKVRYHDRPPRYAYVLTEKGESLRPVLLAMSDWSQTNLPSRWSTPDWFKEARPAPRFAPEEE